MKIFDKKTSIWKRRWNSFLLGFLSEGNGKLEIMGRKLDLILLGGSSAIGILTLSWVGVLIMSYLFVSLKEYSKIILLIFYTLTIFSFWGSLRSLNNKYFKKGYFWTAIIIILIFSVGAIMGGPKLRW